MARIIGHTQMRHRQGQKSGVRWAITWLHKRANEASHPVEKAALNALASDLGCEYKEALAAALEQVVDIASKVA